MVFEILSLTWNQRAKTHVQPLRFRWNSLNASWTKSISTIAGVYKSFNCLLYIVFCPLGCCFRLYLPIYNGIEKKWKEILECRLWNIDPFHPHFGDPIHPKCRIFLGQCWYTCINMIKRDYRHKLKQKGLTYSVTNAQSIIKEIKSTISI